MPRSDSINLSTSIVQEETNGDRAYDEIDGDENDEQNDAEDDNYEDGDEALNEDMDDDDSIDPVYIADTLRELGVDWLKHPQYATHRLIVLQDQQQSPPDVSSLLQTPQYYRVMAQFLVPVSAIFRDVILVKEQEDEHHLQDSDTRRRLGCLEYIPGAEASGISFPPVPTTSQLLPTGMFLPSFVEQVSEDDSLPVLRLYLPHPEHFPALLRVMYNLDLDCWERDHFRPETIGPMTENVSRLECASELTMRCLKYYRRVKSTLSREQLEHESMTALRALYRRAMEAGLLPTDAENAIDVREA